MPTPPEAKYYRFEVRFSRQLADRQQRSLAFRLGRLDSDAPGPGNVYPDGVSEFDWRMPPDVKHALKVLSSLGVPYRYRFVPWGRDHRWDDCQICDEHGPYMYGGVCPPQLVEGDWISVDPASIQDRR